MNKNICIKTTLLVLMVFLCLSVGCKKSEPSQTQNSNEVPKSTSSAHNQVQVQSLTPAQKTEAMLSSVGLDVVIKDYEKCVAVAFKVSQENPKLDAVVKSGLIAGAAAKMLESDKRCVVIGFLDGQPASAIEVDLAKARNFINASGEFSADAGFKVIDAKVVCDIL